MAFTSKIFIGALFALTAILAWQYELLTYGLMQAKGQAMVMIEARPVHEFIRDPDFPDSLKAKLRLVEEIRNYGFENLGINPSDNYTTLYDQKGKVSLWNLTACEPYQLEAKTWSFPLLGSFPYKGFFDLERAKEERDQLAMAGYDTRIRPVNGWSTLGWFSDPILSNMLLRPVGRLAELILHELTHGTLYIKDSADYNENLATFIGEKGAQKFLIDRYGSESKEYRNYMNAELDYEKYVQHFIRGAQSLDSLYQKIGLISGDQEKQALKEQHIRKIVNHLDTVSFSDGGRYQARFANRLPNNAYFMSFMRYHSKQVSFEEEYREEFDSDIKAYLTYLKQKYPSL